MNKELHLIINHTAGSGKGARTAKIVTEELSKQQITYYEYPTAYPKHAAEIAVSLASTIFSPDALVRQAGKKILPVLIVIGGDGTLHEVINALYVTAPTIPTGYIPSGSGNDFARGAGISLRPKEALAQILAAGEPRPIYLIRYEEALENEIGVFTNNIGIGLDARIVEAANASAAKKSLNKFQLGAFSYLAAVLKVLFKQQAFTVSGYVDQQPIHFDQAFLCTTTNIPYFGGGLAVWPDASPYEANIDLVILEYVPMRKIPKIVWLLLRHKHATSPYIHHYRGTSIALSCPSLQQAQADGEMLGVRPYLISYTPVPYHIWC